MSSISSARRASWSAPGPPSQARLRPPSPAKSEDSYEEFHHILSTTQNAFENVPETTRMTQTRPSGPLGQFQTRLVKPLARFLTLPYLRAQQILHLARGIHAFHMQSIYIARQALHLVILLNDVVDPREGPDDDQCEERNDLDDELMGLNDSMEKWGANHEAKDEGDYDQCLTAIQYQYTLFFKERSYFHDPRNLSSDAIYRKLLAYDEKTIRFRQCQRAHVADSTASGIQYWAEKIEEGKGYKPEAGPPEEGALDAFASSYSQSSIVPLPSPPGHAEQQVQKQTSVPSSSPQGSRSERFDPSRLTTESHTILQHEPMGDSGKRAASLDDLRLPSLTTTSTLPPSNPFYFPLPTKVSAPLCSAPNLVNRDGERRWHALMELIDTEEHYAANLEILVRIYLVQLSLVTSLEVDGQKEIARSAEALLTLHQRIHGRLSGIALEEGIKDLKDWTDSTDVRQKLEKAIDRVAAVFIDEASSFHLYESFCARYPRAVDCIRRAHGSEWDIYEARCAAIMMGGISGGVTPKPPEGNATTIVTDPKPSLGMSQTPPNGSPSVPKVSVLKMRDFLIRPVSRICRYPLMLRSLQLYPVLPSSPSSPELTPRAEAILGSSGPCLMERALEVMTQAAANADRATMNAHNEIKTRLILERISGQSLPELHLLGTCLLAGSLDVLYYHEVMAPIVPPIKVKYHGVFLYDGWILLVKALKNNVYEPRHWFPLSSAYMTDILEEDALLPVSFRLSSGDHHFDIAASCSQEKVLWMTRIAFAQTRSTLSSNELPSSLRATLPKPPTPQAFWSSSPAKIIASKSAASVSLSPTSEDVPTNPLKRGMSIAGISGGGTTQTEKSSVALIPRTTPDTLVSASVVKHTPTTPTPDQMRKLFGSDLSIIVIHRASARHRGTVDKSLRDVFFGECQAVRFHAQRTTPLFQPPKITPGGPLMHLSEPKEVLLGSPPSEVARAEAATASGFGSDSGYGSTYDNLYSSRYGPSSQYTPNASSSSRYHSYSTRVGQRREQLSVVRSKNGDLMVLRDGRETLGDRLRRVLGLDPKHVKIVRLKKGEVLLARSSHIS